MREQNQSKIDDLMTVFFKEPRKWLKEIREAPILTTSGKELYWLATCYLASEPPSDLSGEILAWAGTGTDVSRRTARHKAVTEAVERWAIIKYDLRNQKIANFDKDNSSTGVAAYPLDVDRARSNAYKESVERYVFSQLAESAFNISSISRFRMFFARRANAHIKSLKKNYPRENIFLFEVKQSTQLKVVLCLMVSKRGAVAGFAAEKSLIGAVEKALIEAHRHRFVLDKIGESTKLVSRTEGALKYWGLEAGEELVCAWITSRVENKNYIVVPDKLEIDQELKGPWNPEIRIWRCLFGNTLASHQCPVTILYY